MGMDPARWPRLPVLLLALGCAGWALAVASSPAVAESGPRIRPRPEPDRPDRPDRPNRPTPIARVGMRLVDAGSRALRTFSDRGRTYVLGRQGERYRIRIDNPTSSRVEAVVSVDGLDAVDGKPASVGKRGYVVAPFGEVTIEGFRTSMDDVATFRFSSVRDSYAARKGDDRNVGVIGVALFRERMPEPPPPSAAAPVAPGKQGGAARSEAKADDRRGLGTEFGERRESAVESTRFERASSSPDRVIELRYDDREGLLRLGIPLDEPGESDRRDSAEPFPDRRFATPP